MRSSSNSHGQLAPRGRERRKLIGMEWSFIRRAENPLVHSTFQNIGDYATKYSHYYMLPCARPRRGQPSMANDRAMHIHSPRLQPWEHKKNHGFFGQPLRGCGASPFMPWLGMFGPSGAWLINGHSEPPAQSPPTLHQSPHR